MGSKGALLDAILPPLRPEIWKNGKWGLLPGAPGAAQTDPRAIMNDSKPSDSNYERFWVHFGFIFGGFGVHFNECASGLPQGAFEHNFGRQNRSQTAQKIRNPEKNLAPLLGRQGGSEAPRILCDAILALRLRKFGVPGTFRNLSNF